MKSYTEILVASVIGLESLVATRTLPTNNVMWSQKCTTATTNVTFRIAVVHTETRFFHSLDC
jgi:hypothetical protein